MLLESKVKMEILIFLAIILLPLTPLIFSYLLGSTQST